MNWIERTERRHFSNQIRQANWTELMSNHLNFEQEDLISSRTLPALIQTYRYLVGDTYVHTFSIFWAMQRVIKRRFTFETSVGDMEIIPSCKRHNRSFCLFVTLLPTSRAIQDNVHQLPPRLKSQRLNEHHSSFSSDAFLKETQNKLKVCKRGFMIYKSIVMQVSDSIT